MLWLIFVIALLRFESSPWLASSGFLLFNSAHAVDVGLVDPPKGCQDVQTTRQESREKAAIVVLIRESDLDELLPTLDNFEDVFNAQFRYPYVFIGSPDLPPFSSNFTDAVTARLPPDAEVKFGTADEAHWSIPPWLDPEETRAGFAKQAEERVQYAGREGYHHMCRWYSGLFAREGILSEYDWYWRLEPGVRFYSKVTYDPFRFMAMHDKVYGFVITIVETPNTIPTLFSTLQSYMAEHDIVPDQRMWTFLTTDNGTKYSLCHFWTNFEIGDLRFFRSSEYQSLFSYLDRAGGFFTERWGDAPIRSLALGMLSSIDRVHYFEDIAYKHDWFMHCPQTANTGVGCRTQCPAFSPAAVDIDNDIWYSCLPKWREVVR